MSLERRLRRQPLRRKHRPLCGRAGEDQGEAHRARQNHFQTHGRRRPALATRKAEKEMSRSRLRDPKPTSHWEKSWSFYVCWRIQAQSATALEPAQQEVDVIAARMWHEQEQSSVAEKQLPYKLLDQWCEWLSAEDDETLQSLEVFTKIAASLTSGRGRFNPGWCAFVMTRKWRASCTGEMIVVGSMYGPVDCQSESQSLIVSDVLQCHRTHCAHAGCATPCCGYAA